MYLTKAQRTLVFRFVVALGFVVVTAVVLLLVYPGSPIAISMSPPSELPSGSASALKDVDECLNRIHNCHDQFGICTNTVGSFTCRCIDNWVGDGVTCNENECLTGRNNCHSAATCTDTVQGFYCTCKGSTDNKWPGSRGLNPPFYTGNGTFCDVNQCAAGRCRPELNITKNCNTCWAYPNTSMVDSTVSANCTDLPDTVKTRSGTGYYSGYSCTCLPGFIKDDAGGLSCQTDDGNELCAASPCNKNTTICVSDLPAKADYGKPRPGMDPKCIVSIPYCCDCKWPKNQTRIK